MKNSTVTLILFAIAAALLISGCATYGGNQPAAPPAPPALPAGQGASANTIEITAAGFSPSTLTIKAGDTVTWINKDTAQHWPASALHPTHAVYPEPGGCFASKFDACKGLEAGESFSFTFTHVGEWKYHDHLNPTLFGTIAVG